MATELADLVMAGIKRATASLARDYGEGREPIPQPSDFVLMLDGEGRPRFIWRTTEVTIKPLSQVDEAFAWDEGEGAEHHLRSGCRNRYCETSGLEHTEFFSHAFPIGTKGAVGIRSGLGGLVTCCQCLSAMGRGAVLHPARPPPRQMM